MLGANPRTSPGQVAPSAPSVTLPSYVTPLSIPPVLRPSSNGSPLHIRMRSFQGKVHRDLPPTTMWGYNSSWPGPTFEVRRGQSLAVKWTNELPLKHFLPIDPSIHGAEEGVPEARTIVHLHGVKVLPDSDGYPDSWYTPDGKVWRCSPRRSSPLSERSACRHPLVSRSCSRHYASQRLCGTCR
jgi:spore coat protein A, manganese oxidase